MVKAGEEENDNQVIEAFSGKQIWRRAHWKVKDSGNQFLSSLTCVPGKCMTNPGYAGTENSFLKGNYTVEFYATVIF